MRSDLQTFRLLAHELWRVAIDVVRGVRAERNLLHNHLHYTHKSLKYVHVNDRTTPLHVRV